MERERTENGARSRETIYYLSSVEKDGGFLLCDAYSCALGYREQTALASRRDVSGRYVPRTRQEWRCQFFSDAQVCIGNA